MKEKEMEMRAKEEIEIGTDITPPLTPLAFSLHHSHLHSHCSACFSPLPTPSFPNNSTHIPTLFYCSPLCSAADSPLHLSSGEHHLRRLPHPASLSSDLRAALRFLHSHRPLSRAGRIAGLLVNRHKLIGDDHTSDEVSERITICDNRSGDEVAESITVGDNCSGDEVSERCTIGDGVSKRIRIGARAMAAAIAMQRGGGEPDDAVLEEATVALCLVLTNAVEVQDNSGRSLGIAVFDPTFCWINHSCSPNACYRFILPSPSFAEAKLRIAPFTRNSQETQQVL